jgi:Protein of unknown function (DUF3102)
MAKTNDGTNRVDMPPIPDSLRQYRPPETVGAALLVPTPGAVPAVHADVLHQGSSLMSDLQLAFDYASLDVQTRAVCVEAAEKIRHYGKRAAESIVAIGEELTRVKAVLGHGHWLPWLEAEFGWSESYAKECIQVYEWRQKSPTVGDLGLFQVKALFDIARPSTPEAVREEAIERAASGQRVTHAAVREMKERGRKRPADADDETDQSPPVTEPVSESEPAESAAPPEKPADIGTAVKGADGEIETRSIQEEITPRPDSPTGEEPYDPERMTDVLRKIVDRLLVDRLLKEDASDTCLPENAVSLELLAEIRASGLSKDAVAQEMDELGDELSDLARNLRKMPESPGEGVVAGR